MSRRSWAVPAVLAVPALLATLVIAPTAARATPGPTPKPTAVPDLRVPAPTGPYRLGTTSLHLVDDTRTDPLAPTVRRRELIVQLWYPAAPSRQPFARYLPPGVAARYAEAINLASGTDYPASLLTFPTHSRRNAPAIGGPRRPLLLFSPGLGVSAAMYSGMLEDLASRGYVVAGIDHTFDAGAVEFPGGRVELQPEDLVVDETLRAVRTADARFVLDQLAVIAAGGNPDAEHRPLPAGLARAMDLRRVGGFGHSLGSPTLIRMMLQDRRLDTVAALDGDLDLPDPGRPVLLMGNEFNGRATNPEWAAFYDRLTALRRHLVLVGARHADFGDVGVWKAVVDLVPIFGPQFGSIDGIRALTIQRRYLTAWFDLVLRGRPSPLLRGETARFPEVDFQP